jgi:hypothetical protein
MTEAIIKKLRVFISKIKLCYNYSTLTLPSKKIIILSCVCLVALGSIVYNKVEPGSLLVTPALTLTVVQSTSTLSNVQALQNKIAANEPTATTTGLEPSLTEAISQDFLTNFTTLKTTNPNDIAAQAQLIDNLTQKYATSTKITLALKDISTFSDKDTVKAKAFGNASMHAILNYYNTLKVSPIDVLNESTKANATTSIQANLVPIAKAYRSLGLELEQIPVPATFAPYYLDIVNGYLGLGDDVDYMSAYSADPVKGFIGLTNYQNDLFKQVELLKNIPNYLKANGILFSKGEDGVLWSSL